MSRSGTEVFRSRSRHRTKPGESQVAFQRLIGRSPRWWLGAVGRGFNAMGGYGVLYAGLAFMLAVETTQTAAAAYATSNAFPGLTFTNPVAIVSPPGETNRLFIVEKKGRIVVITNLAAPTRTVFMDISSSSSVISAADTI